jgi:hypothetical protein
MVLVVGLAAIPSGAWPTPTAAVSVMQALGTWAELGAEDADVAEAMRATAVIATMIRRAARWVNRTMSCLLTFAVVQDQRPAFRAALLPLPGPRVAHQVADMRRSVVGSQSMPLDMSAESPAVARTP